MVQLEIFAMIGDYHEPTSIFSVWIDVEAEDEMIIRRNAIVPEQKVRDYLLVPLSKADKSKYLSLAGYTREEYWELLRDIREQLLPCEADYQRTDRYGDYFIAKGQLTGPNGRSLGVRTIWLCEPNGTIRFATLFPD